MPLSQTELEWMRDAWDSRGGGDPSVVPTIEQLARRTPAWIAPYVVLYRQLVDEAAPDFAGAPEFACPQIVDVDFPTMAFDRAEWIGSSLYLGLAPRYEDPKVFTTFRIVGVEPRQWDIAGIDGAMVDARGNGTIVRVPLLRRTMSFTPSSY